jgi:protein gp37
VGDRSAIGWTNATWNPIAGCTRVSEGCDNCYAATLVAGRLKNRPQYNGLAVITPSGRAAFNGRIRLLPERYDQPHRWRKPRRIFVNSMSDLFHETVPEFVISRIFDEMARAPWHTFQVLTKRPERMAALVPTFAARHTARDGTGWPMRHVWLGTSCENQPTADERIPWLLKTPAAVRFVSLEPLLGQLRPRLRQGVCAEHGPGPASDGTHFIGDRASTFCPKCGWAYRTYEEIHWVVIGGESGTGHRQMDVAWAESIAAQCQAAGVPVFIKQDSGPHPGKQGRLSDALWALKQYPFRVPVES